MSEEKNIPYKIYLEESEMPKQWYNVRADMKIKPAPLLNPATLEPSHLNGILYYDHIDKIDPWKDDPTVQKIA